MKNKTLSDVFDSYINWIVFCLFLLAVHWAMEASGYLVNDVAGEQLQTWADWPAHGSVIAVAVALIILLRLPQDKRKRRDRRALLDEFVTEVYRRATVVAFLLTIVLVPILDNVANNSQLPASFFIKVVGFSLTAGFSISFFLINLQSSENEEL